ncbi:hypothetical protein E1301_Tti012766 [Triplophysa tibetana]|uniref:Ig-like domain-containing protein n=1 Tax=Triplophysa tibetana TaxID=1572043 RepID=A0A5A9NSR6_9TELE|nr:hypothetical protein E1301_Tti012766 [Triplophysa tibetana]
MKNAFTVYLLLISVCGVFGVDPDEVKSVSVMEGESVTLHTNLTDIQTDIQLTWTFKLQASLIAEIIMGNQINVIFVSNDGIFKDRLEMNNQTGSLTITNLRTKHSGLYKLQISSITETLSKRFRLTVYDSLPLIDAETGELKTVSVTEGDPANLMMKDVEIQRYDLIVWRFGDDGILIVKGDREDNKTTFTHDEIYEDRLELNYQTGSLTITDARITDTGLYKVKISGDRMAKYKRFILTVSASGISSGGVAVAGIVVLLGMSGAVGLFVFLYRRRISEIKKHTDVLVDKTVLMKPGDSVALHTGVKEIQKDDDIMWMFEGSSIAKMKGDQTIENIDDRFKGKLKLNHQSGSLTIKDTKTGLYKVKMRLQDVTSAQIFSVSESDKLSVNEGDPFTLSSGQTELGDNVMTWRLKDKDIVTISERQVSVCVEERFKDRVHVDPQTGSLTVTNSKTKDSGLYQLEINDSNGTTKPERKFIVTVLEEIRKVSVTEGDSVALNPDCIFIQRPDMITWKFGNRFIANLTENTPDAPPFVDESFRDRLELDHQTGSLTIKNITNTDSGLYTLKIDSEDSEWKFSVTVRGRSIWKKLPQPKEVNTQDESELPMILTSSQIFSVSASDKLSVNEGDPFTLSSGHTEIGEKVITWRFGDVLVATNNGNIASVCDEERFKDRVHVDPQTGSLTVTHSKTKNSGLYQLQISGKEKSERKFTVTVRETTVNKQNEPEIQMIQDSPSIMTELTGRTSIKLPKQKEEKIRKVSVMEGESFTLNTWDVFTQRPELIKWMFGDKCIAELIGKQLAVSAVFDDRFTDRLKLDHQTGSLTITNTRTTDSGNYILRINPGLTEDLEFKFNVIVSAPTKNEGIVPETTHSLMMTEDPSDRRNESDPLLRKDCVNVVDEKEGMSE